MAKANKRARASTAKTTPVEFKLLDVVKIKAGVGTIRGVADYIDRPLREFQIRYRNAAGEIEHAWVTAGNMTHA